MGDELSLEDKYARDLRGERAKPEEKSAGQNVPSNEETGKLEKLVANKDKTAIFVMMGLLAVIGSTLGAVPLVGWLISLVTAAGISACAFAFEGKPKLQAQALNAGGVVGNIVAAIFLVDAVPEQILAVILIWLVVQYGAHKAEEKLKQMKSGK